VKISHAAGTSPLRNAHSESATSGGPRSLADIRNERNERVRQRMEAATAGGPKSLADIRDERNERVRQRMEAAVAAAARDSFE
jgi:hypothetical protein